MTVPATVMGFFLAHLPPVGVIASEGRGWPATVPTTVPTEAVNCRNPLHKGRPAAEGEMTSGLPVLVNMPHTRCDNIAEAGQSCLVDAGSEAMHSEMWGEVTVIKFLPEQINVGEKSCHCVRVLRGLHPAKEHAAARPIVVIESYFSL